MTQHYIGIDLGGTKILAVVATAEGEVIARVKRKTMPKNAPAHPDQRALISRIAAIAREAVAKAGLQQHDIKAVGLGAPGPVNIHTGWIANAVNIPGWEHGFMLGPTLSGELHLPVYVDNDVNVALLGEITYGAARGIDDVVSLFVGTGLGGAIALGGKLRRGFRWGAGEVGHTYLYWPGKQPRDIESIASRGAIGRKLAKAVRKGKSPIVAELAARRKDGRITSGVIRRALAAGDPVTQAAVKEAQEAIAVLIASITNLLDPQAFLLGGGLVESLGEPFLEPIRQRARKLFFVQEYVEDVRIMPVSLGDDAGALGAVALAISLQ